MTKTFLQYVFVKQFMLELLEDIDSKMEDVKEVSDNLKRLEESLEKNHAIVSDIYKADPELYEKLTANTAGLAKHVSKMNLSLLESMTNTCDVLTGSNMDAIEVIDEIRKLVNSGKQSHVVVNALRSYLR